MCDRELTAGLVRRAAAAGAQALVLTADTPVVGRKAQMPRHGLTMARLPGQPRPAGGPGRAAYMPVSLADIGWLTDVSGGCL